MFNNEKNLVAFLRYPNLYYNILRININRNFMSIIIKVGKGVTGQWRNGTKAQRKTGNYYSSFMSLCHCAFEPLRHCAIPPLCLLLHPFLLKNFTVNTHNHFLYRYLPGCIRKGSFYHLQQTSATWYFHHHNSYCVDLCNIDH